MTQRCLNMLPLVAVELDLDFDILINDFSSQKARRKCFALVGYFSPLFCVVVAMELYYIQYQFVYSLMVCCWLLHLNKDVF